MEAESVATEEQHRSIEERQRAGTEKVLAAACKRDVCNQAFV
jgi:hypothetical protein